MKITKQKLVNLIKEELTNHLNEGAAFTVQLSSEQMAWLDEALAMMAVDDQQAMIRDEILEALRKAM